MVFLTSRMSNMFDPTMNMDPTSPDFAQHLNEFIQGCAGFAAGATAAVILRLIARWQNATKFCFDDMAIALSLLPLWALAGVGIALAVYGGLGKMVHDLSVAEESIYYPTVFVSYILYALSITSAKLSILLLYHRIFTTKAFRRILHIFMALCTIWCIAAILLTIFRCSPIAASWSTHKALHAMPHKCIPLTNLYYGTSTTNLLLDIIINLLPLRQIWTLQLPTRQRILLIICLGLGMVSIAAGIGRILTIASLQSAELPGAIAEPDVVAMPYLFLVIEPAFAVICACLPTYRPLAIWLGKKASASPVGTKVRSILGSSTVFGSSRISATSSSALPGPWSQRPPSSRFSWIKFGKSDVNVTVHPIEEGQIEKRTLLSVNSTQVTPDSSPDLSGGRSYSRAWSGQ